MKTMLVALWLFTILSACSAQERPSLSQATSLQLLGGPCEGCDAIFEYEGPPLNAVDTLSDFTDTGPRLKVTGTIYQPDGRTPAEGVVLYIYHTDQEGVYPTRGGERGWARHHGYLRGWIKTGADGKYTFYTLRPASYPNTRAPQHIHATLQEPNGAYYYIADYHFDDDPNLAGQDRNPRSPRGGSGTVSVKREGDLWVARRDIVLGLNVPNYE